MSDNNQDVTMANQQERLSETDLAWLAGIVDGEGTIAINCNSTRRSIYPHISIASVGTEIIEKCKRIFTLMKVKFGEVHRIPRDGQRIPSTCITILTSLRVKKVIEHIYPYLTVKKNHADIILKFCNSRISLPYGYPYTEEELQLFYEIKKYQIKINRHSGRIPNDYTPGWRPRYKNLHKI